MGRGKRLERKAKERKEGKEEKGREFLEDSKAGRFERLID